VFIYTPATSSWKDVSDPGMHYWTKDVVVDPADSTQNTWYVGVFSGWGGPPNGLGGLYRTTDRGGTWKRISALDRVTSCTINPWDHSEMYLTTETNGLWRSTNFGSPSPTFSPVGGYPFRQPERVFYNPFTPGELWVTSFGAGLMVGKSGTSGVLKSTATAPAGISLQQNFPNPFNPSTTIRYTIGGARRQGSGASQVRLVVYDILGRQVAVLVNAWETPGTYTVQFDATGLASGIYFCRLQSGTFVEERKLCLVR
ncbi:MAG TPA: T9SS type A sorting domain-containing protein, partial [Bacteroidota bacterium]|nr:T9SS type A sorting domain-containing protein [Bacteroidota bacterium]